MIESLSCDAGSGASRLVDSRSGLHRIVKWLTRSVFSPFLNYFRISIFTLLACMTKYRSTNTGGGSTRLQRPNLFCCEAFHPTAVARAVVWYASWLCTYLPPHKDSCNYCWQSENLFAYHEGVLTGVVGRDGKSCNFVGRFSISKILFVE